MTPEEEAECRAGWRAHFDRMKIMDEEAARSMGLPHWLYRMVPGLLLVGAALAGITIGGLIAGLL